MMHVHHTPHLFHSCLPMIFAFQISSSIPCSFCVVKSLGCKTPSTGVDSVPPQKNGGRIKIEPDFPVKLMRHLYLLAKSLLCHTSPPSPKGLALKWKSQQTSSKKAGCEIDLNIFFFVGNKHHLARAICPGSSTTKVGPVLSEKRFAHWANRYR
jgi:hypothetical protein